VYKATKLHWTELECQFGFVARIV